MSTNQNPPNIWNNSKMLMNLQSNQWEVHLIKGGTYSTGQCKYASELKVILFSLAELMVHCLLYSLFYMLYCYVLSALYFNFVLTVYYLLEVVVSC
jgi:hypothetical protein